jgi:hypothetical protein
MASSYSQDLKLELMVTGEKAGLWGDITNTNLNILQQAIAGYTTLSVNSTTTGTLTFSNGVQSNGKNMVIDITGTPSGACTVTMPDSVEKYYVIKNSTGGTETVTVKTSGQELEYLLQLMKKQLRLFIQMELILLTLILVH